MIKIIIKLKTIIIIQVNKEELDIAYEILKIWYTKGGEKEHKRAREFEEEFNRLGENTEKCKTFSVLITK